MKASHLTLALTAMALASCNAQKKEEAAIVDPAAIEQELKAIEADWVIEYNTRDLEKAAGHYADDAALANPGSALATDAASRRAEVEKFVGDPSTKVDFASDRIQVAKSGDLATTRGHYKVETTDPATKKVVINTGSYLTVYKKQADGSWKAVEDFVTPGVSPSP